jgi:tetratricopeptide (TPR) repeat protein
MSYPGDTSLSNEIKDRILTTFEQALELTESGSRKEALLGCDFVLRLDPLFEPARVLHKRLRDTDSEVLTEDLRGTLQGDPAAALSMDSLAAATEGLEVTESMEPPLAEGQPADEPVEPGESDGEEISFADQVEAELAAKFDESPREEASSTFEDGALSPDTALPEPGLAQVDLSALGGDPESEDSPDDAIAEDLYEPSGVESSVMGPEGLPLEGDGAELEDAAEPLGTPVQLDAESERRIAELLDEGQTSFDKGEYQSAIDSWSRVFLIDIDHQEANRRIEEARRLAAEAERQVEEVFHEAMSRMDEGDLDAARDALNRVLELQPTHLAALEYLERIDSGDVAHPGLPEPPDMDPTVEPEIDLATEAPEEEEDGPDDLFAAPDLAAFDDVESDSATSPVKPPRKKPDPRRMFISVGSAVFVLVAIGGWFLYDNWSMFFPNAQSAQDVPPPPRIDPIRRAQALHEEGKTAIAIAQLRRLPPGDPHYAEAQALVAQWETAAPEVQPDRPTAAELERFRAIVASARTAHASGENLLAFELLERAEAIAELDDSELAVKADAEARLASLSEQIEIFRSGDWEYALPTLWRMREADRNNADITRLIIDCYYNLGVRDLQRGRPDSAARKFEEALSLRPGDPTLARMKAFAETYTDRPEDLLYRIFVKYLPFR